MSFHLSVRCSTAYLRFGFARFDISNARLSQLAGTSPQCAHTLVAQVHFTAWQAMLAGYMLKAGSKRQQLAANAASMHML